MSPEIQTFLLSMTPFGEIRVAIPIALTIFRLDWILAYFISVLGNLVPVALIILFLEPISAWLSKSFKIFRKFFSWLFERTRQRYTSKVEKYGSLALILFVAIPLPVTGGWTGALIAFLFGIPFKKAFPLITLGVMTAGLIVLFLTKAGFTIEKFLGLQTLFGILLIVGLGWITFGRIKKQKNA